MSPSETNDYDSPWKEALEVYFPDFMAFFFPQAYEDIDWSRGYEFLDQEFQQIVRDAELGKRLVDKLVKVWRKDNQEALVLIHLEVQSQYEAQFNQRVFVYNYRIFDRYKLPVASLVILADDRPNWTPKNFGYELWDSKISFEFPSVKLLQYQDQWDQLQEDVNPFAVMVMAHLKTQATRQQPDQRLQWKLEVTKSLYRRGYSRQNILELFRLVNWIMTLPEELELSFNTEIAAFEEEEKMPYITPLERFAQEAGVSAGVLTRGREDILDILETRFGPVPSSLSDRINAIDDATYLKTLLIQAVTLPSLEDFEQAIAPNS
ncbi:transposase [Sodalinema gerasimenkoae]|uniref:transposase n=1 Tax=Sodalinema gerasimenkoae TaxID=2862348 RepID=UPI001359E88F|nr:transposase [Sodalinema gerasimenkoae]